MNLPLINSRAPLIRLIGIVVSIGPGISLNADAIWRPLRVVLTLEDFDASMQKWEYHVVVRRLHNREWKWADPNEKRNGTELMSGLGKQGWEPA